MQSSKKPVKKTEDSVIELTSVEEIKDTVDPVVEKPVKKTRKKAEVTEEKPVKKTVKKEAVAKPAATAKTVAKKPSTKTATTEVTAENLVSTRKTLKVSIFIQHDGKELEDKDIIAKVKEVWVSELGNKIGDMKSLTTYIKPEEESIYYVINDEVTGRIDF